MKRLLIAALFAVLIFSAPPRVRAQTPAPELIAGPVSITAELRAQIEAYLAVSPPSVTAYYAPTYVQDEGQYTLISLAALNIQSAEEPWLMEGTDEQPANVIWVGTIRINLDGSGSLHSAPGMARTRLPKLAMPLLRDILPGPGGGTYVRLPFQASKAMLYGVRGIHGAGDYGTSGMRAVDLVGGPGLGSNVASAGVYASYTGTVDYVCTDDYQAVIRTYNAATDDYFIYAHMYDNASLELDHVFQAGASIGTLRPGTFTDDCGLTEQDDSIYHNHWMFEPSGGNFRVGPYTLTQSDGKFHAGPNVYGTGSWITNTSTPTGADDPGPGASSATPNFWDFVVNGIVSAAGGMAAQLPGSSTSVTIFHSATTIVSLMFRMAWILVRGNLNLTVFAIVMVAVITFRLIMAVPALAFWVIGVVRYLKQTFSPLG